MASTTLGNATENKWILPQDSHAVQQTPDEKPEKRTCDKLIVLIIVLLIAIAILTALVIYFAVKDDNATTEEPEEEAAAAGTDVLEEYTYSNASMPTFCEYASEFWDDPSTPLSERNNIGMAKYLTSEHVLKAAQLSKIGKVYKLAYPFTNTMPSASHRAWYTALQHPAGGAGGAWGGLSPFYLHNQSSDTYRGSGYQVLEQRLMTSSIGNSGTQFDALGHVFWINGEFGDERHYVFFNGFNGVDVLQQWGVNYIGVEQLPPFITRAILIDVAGYVGTDSLPATYEITTDIIEETMEYQGMSVDDIETGDVVLFYTGWAEAYWYTDPDSYYLQAPGLTVDTVVNIFGPKKVLMIGADNWGIESNIGVLPLHVHWLVCHGGFNYESLKLVEWVEDARNGSVPYMGGFYYSPAQIAGGVGGLGTPMVVV